MISYVPQDTAGQLRRSPYEFAGIGATSPLLWLARRFAILDGPTMPIIAGTKKKRGARATVCIRVHATTTTRGTEGADEEPNDTYVEQLVASAQAAVDELVRRGVADPQRIAVGGHSYGTHTQASNALGCTPRCTRWLHDGQLAGACGAFVCVWHRA